jgi:A/G-specific adenine glycosylase
LPLTVGHVFTHFSLSLKVAVTSLRADADPPCDGEYWPVNSLDKAGLPTLFNKAAKAVIASGRKFTGE